MSRIALTAAAVVVGTLVAVVLLDVLIRWAETQSKRSYDNPNYVPGSSFTPLMGILNPDAQRQRDVLEAKQLQGADAEADGAPPTPGEPRRGAGPTSF